MRASVSTFVTYRNSDTYAGETFVVPEQKVPFLALGGEEQGQLRLRVSLDLGFQRPFLASVEGNSKVDLDVMGFVHLLQCLVDLQARAFMPVPILVAQGPQRFVTAAAVALRNSFANFLVKLLRLVELLPEASGLKLQVFRREPAALTSNSPVQTVDQLLVPRKEMKRSDARIKPKVKIGRLDSSTILQFGPVSVASANEANFRVALPASSANPLSKSASNRSISQEGDRAPRPTAKPGITKRVCRILRPIER